AHPEGELRDVVADLGAGLDERRLPALEYRSAELHHVGASALGRRLFGLDDRDENGRDYADDEPAGQTSTHKRTSEGINCCATAGEAPESAPNGLHGAFGRAQFLRVKQALTVLSALQFCGICP